MCITYSLQVTGYLQWLINAFTDLEIGNTCSLTAAVPMDNPYCSCELTRVRRDEQHRACQALFGG